MKKKSERPFETPCTSNVCNLIDIQCTDKFFLSGLHVAWFLKWPFHLFQLNLFLLSPENEEMSLSPLQLFVQENPSSLCLVPFSLLSWCNGGLELASHADVLRGSSHVPAPRGTGPRDEPLRTSAWEASLKLPSFWFTCKIFGQIVFPQIKGNESFSVETTPLNNRSKRTLTSLY